MRKVWVVHASNSTEAEILDCAESLEDAVAVIEQTMSLSAVTISLPYTDTAVVSATAQELYGDQAPRVAEWLLERRSLFESGSS